MPTIVDALVTTLTLDAREYIANAERQRAALKNLTADQRQLLQDHKQFQREKTQLENEADRKERFREREDQKQGKEKERRLKDAERAESDHAKQLESSSKQQENSLRKVALQATALIGIFTAGRGIRDFVASLTSGDAASGRLAKNINMSVEELTRWQSLATNFGGDSQGVAQMFASWSDDINNAALTGQSTMIPMFQQLRVQVVDMKGNIRSYSDILKDIAASPVFRAMNRPQQTAYLKRMGVEQGTANAIMEGPVALAKALKEQPIVSEKDAANAILFEKNLEKIKNTSMALGRTIFNDLAPSINQLLEMFKAIMDQNGPEITKNIGEALKVIVEDLKAVKWKVVGEEIRDIVRDINAVVTALGGWGRASEALFLLWVGGKFMSMLGGVLTITGLLGRLPGMATTAGAGIAAGAVPAAGGVAAGGLLRAAAGTVLRAAPYALAADILFNPSTTNKGEDAAVRQMHMRDPTWNGGTPVTQQISESASKQNVDAKIALAFAKIESDFGRSKDNPGSQYKGVFQLGNEEWKSLGGTDADRNDRTKQIELGVKRVGQLQNEVTRALGRPGAAWELYMAHNQGVGGLKAYSADPNRPAIEAMASTAEGRQKGMEFARNAVLLNLTKSQRAQIGDNPTSGQFLGSMHNRFDTAIGGVGGGMPDPRNYAQTTTSKPPGNDNNVTIGDVHINTQATDATGIARDIHGELSKYSYVRQANTGVVS